MQPQHTQTPLSSLLGLNLKTNATANAMNNGSSSSFYPSSPPSSNNTIIINNSNNTGGYNASALPNNNSNSTNNSATSANTLQTLVRQIQYLLLSGGGAQGLAELMNKLGMESTQFCQLVAFAQQNLQQHQQQIVQPQQPQQQLPPLGVMATTAPQVSSLAVHDRTATIKDPSPQNSPASSPRGQQSQHQQQQAGGDASKAAAAAQGGKMSEPVTSNVIQIIRLGIKEFLESKRLEFIAKPSSFQIRTEDDENLVKISAKDIWEYLLDNYEDIQQSQYRSYILKKEAPSMFKQYSNIQIDGKTYKFEMEYDVKRGRKSAAYKRRSLERKPATSSSSSTSTSLSPAETSPERPTTPAVEQKVNPNVTIITPTVPKEYLARPISSISTTSSSTCAPPKITTPTTTAPITHANVGNIRFQQKPQLSGQEAQNLLRSHLLRFPELSLLQSAGMTGTEPQFLEQFMVYSDLYDDGKEASERAMKDHEDNMEMH